MDKVKDLSEFAEHIGSEVKLVVEEGVYTGVLCFHDPVKQSILIENGCLNGSGGQIVNFPNALSFRYSEIKDYELLSMKNIPSNSKLKDNHDQPLQKDNHDQPFPAQLEKSARVSPKSNSAAVVSAERNLPQATGSAKSKREGLLLSGLQFSNGIPHRSRMSFPEPETYFVIDHIRFVQEAFDLIKREHTIGCGIDGLHLGKYGLLCWIEIATPKYVFLFDMLILSSDNSFMADLKSILEMPDIVKVIHDCRNAVKLFRHQYDIELKNVYDTQVADMIIQRNAKQGQMPKYVRSLLVLLVEYLKFTEENVQFYSEHRNVLECDKSKEWNKRPAPQPILELAALNVRYLLELHQHTQAALLSDFTQAVNLYLHQDQELETENDGFLVPDEFLKFDYHVQSSNTSLNANFSHNDTDVSQGFPRDRNEGSTSRQGKNIRQHHNGHNRRIGCHQVNKNEMVNPPANSSISNDRSFERTRDQSHLRKETDNKNEMVHSPANSSISSDRSFERTPRDQSHLRKETGNLEEVDYSGMPELVPIDYPEVESKSEPEEHYEHLIQQEQLSFANMTLDNHSKNSQRGMTSNRRGQNYHAKSRSNFKGPQRFPRGRGTPVDKPYVILPTGLPLANGNH